MYHMGAIYLNGHHAILREIPRCLPGCCERDLRQSTERVQASLLAILGIFCYIFLPTGLRLLFTKFDASCQLQYCNVIVEGLVWVEAGVLENSFYE